MASVEKINASRKAQLVEESNTHRYELDLECNNLQEAAAQAEVVYSLLHTTVKNRKTISSFANFVTGRKRNLSGLVSCVKAGWGLVSNSR